MLSSHYAPGLPVRLNADSARPGEAWLAFGPAPRATANLSPSGDLAEAAANLFAFLRAFDKADFTGIAVMPIPNEGLGLAINDRLRRAAAPRPAGHSPAGAMKSSRVFPLSCVRVIVSSVMTIRRYSHHASF